MNLRTRRKSTATKNTDQEETPTIYTEGEILAVYDEDHPDKFFLCKVSKDIRETDEEAEIVASTRGAKPNEAYLTEEATVPMDNVITFVSNASLKKLKKKFTVTSDVGGQSFDSEEMVKLKMNHYKKIVALAENFKLKEDEEDEEDEGDDEEDEEEEEEEEVKNKSRRKVKKIVGVKKGKAAKKSTSRKRTNKRSSSKASSKINTPATEKSSKKKSAKPKKRYKKGKWNLDIEVRETMDQFENQSEVPNLDNSVMNNNREIIRAININSSKLLKKVIYSNQKISSLNPKWGCYDSLTGGRHSYYDYRKKKIYNENSAFCLALLKSDQKVLEILLRAMDPDDKNRHKIEYTSIPAAQIDKVETGYNDKYAYGVATRMVNMSRGNREGNNAFLRDQRQNGNTVSGDDIEWMMGCNRVTLENIQTVISFFPNLRDSFLMHIKAAVRAGNTEKASYFIEENLKRDTYTFNEFHNLALIAKSGQSLKDIQKRNVTKKAQGVGGYSPLHCACINPNIEVLKFMMEMKPEFNLADDEGRKPVHYAAASSSTANLEYLIQNNVDSRDMDLKKVTPLMLACDAGRAENVKFLLGPRRSNIEAKDKHSYAALHYAAFSGSVGCIRALIEGGVDINKGGPDRKTALHIAAERGDYELCEFLIERGARTTSKDKFKRTALISAVMNGNLKCASLLLKHGAPFDCPDSSDNHPLHYACAYGYPELIDLLMEANCDPNLDNSWKLNATTVALLKNYFECVRRMLDYPQTDVNCTDNNGRSLLSLTVKNLTQQSFENFCFLLKEKNADPNHADTFGHSTLHHLARTTVERVFNDNNTGISLLDSEKRKRKKQAEKLYKQFLNEILNNGANVNLKNKDGLTPIFLALTNKNIHAVEILLDQPEIDLNILTNDNETIFHFLTEIVDKPEFLEILQKIVKKLNKVEDLLNQTADSGMNAVHHIVDKFVKNHENAKENFANELRAEVQEKKREKIETLLKKKKLASGTEMNVELEEEDFNGLLGGARTKMTARKSTWGAKVPKKKLRFPKAAFGGAVYQNSNSFGGAGNYGLTIKEEEKIKELAEQKYIEATHNFLDVLRTLKRNGADFTLQTKKPVEKEIVDDQNADIYSRYPKGLFGSYDPYSYYRKNQNQNQNSKNKRKKEIPKWVKSNCLHLTASNSTCFEFFKYLIEETEIDINSKRQDGKTPLLLYIIKNPSENNLEIFNFLISKGSDINICDKDKKSAVFYSCENLNLCYLEKLLELKPDLDIRSKQGETPLIILTKRRNLKLVETMLEGGADINFCDKSGRNVLHWAVNNISSSSDATNELENLLLSSGVDPNKKDKRERTPLHYAFVKIGNPWSNSKIDPIETVSNILSRKEAKCDLSDCWGYTALHYAAQRGSVISALYLIKNGADVNSKNEHGNTPLNLCLINNHKEMAIFLIQKEADLTVPVKVITLKMLKEQDEKRRKKEEEEGKMQEEEIGEDKSDEGMMEEEREEGEEEDDIESQSSESEDGSDTEEDEEEEEEEEEEEVNPGGFGFGGKGLYRKAPRKKRASKRAFGNSWNNNNNIQTDVDNEGIQEDDLDFKSLAEEVTCFMIAIRRNWQGISFLMLEYGFDLSIAVLDCFNAQKFNYVYTLLLKKSDSGFYQMKNKEDQNISHLFCKYSGQITDLDLFNKIYSKIKSKKIDFSLTDKQGKNCLHYSSQSGRIDLTKDLLDLGLDINARDSQNNTPFSLLLKKSYHKLEDYLKVAVEYGLEINQLFPYKDIEHRATTFVTATRPKNSIVQDLDLLAKNGADVNLGDSRGYNPLILMVRENYENQAKQFYNDLSPDLKVCDNEGKNVIHHIVAPLSFGYYQNEELLKFFSLGKALLNKKDNHGNPPIYYANLQSTGVMKKILLKSGADEVEMSENELQKVKSSILNDFEFPEIKYDFEKDFEKFNEECKKRDDERNSKLNIDDDHREKPHKLVSGGDYEVIYDGEDPYSVFMVKVEISRGYYSGNTFYRMQLLREKVRGVIVLFTNWGRNGTDGQYQHTPFGTLEEGVSEFKKIFKQKSKNEWEDRENFQKHEKKYRLVTYTKPNQAKNYLKPIHYKDSSLPESKLEKSIFKFVRRVCNAKIILRNMNNFQFDTDTLAIRDLTKDRIQKAEEILKEILNIINLTNERRTKGVKFDSESANLLTDLSNEFYELIPNSQYKDKAIPPISQIYTVNNYLKMISDLFYREIVIKLLCGAQYRIKEVNPVDYCFNSLNFKILRVGHRDEEYKMIKKYIKVSNQTGLDINKLIANIYAIERRDERENIQKWQENGNKMLLWHGTKSENVIGILQTGFRIAPSDSSHSGSMFGEGVYFSDLFSKSYNYTNSFGYNRYNYNNQNLKPPKKYMLLCEVALGKMKELKQAKEVKSVPSKKYQSVKGIGTSGPDFAKSVYLSNGCMVPLGPTIQYPVVNSGNGGLFYGGLSHNEYVVYDTSQVRIKYVVELRQQ